MIKKKQSPESIEKRVSKLKGRKFSEESKKNIREGIRKNRYTPDYAKKLSDTKLGVKNPQVVLTELQVKEIRFAYSTGEYTQERLSQRYGVGRGTIADIIHRRTWKHI